MFKISFIDSFFKEMPLNQNMAYQLHTIIRYIYKRGYCNIAHGTLSSADFTN